MLQLNRIKSVRTPVELSFARTHAQWFSLWATMALMGYEFGKFVANTICNKEIELKSCLLLFSISIFLLACIRQQKYIV